MVGVLENGYFYFRPPLNQDITNSPLTHKRLPLQHYDCKLLLHKKNSSSILMKMVSYQTSNIAWNSTLVDPCATPVVILNFSRLTVDNYLTNSHDSHVHLCKRQRNKDDIEARTLCNESIVLYGVLRSHAFHT